MPKRSNQFQKMVTYIAEQLVPLGTTVRESVELEETGLTGVFREVDTLIETNVGITRVRIAVESRDRTRKDDIQWVDDLIGKYTGLPVDRVLAVSNAGFSSAAKQKAESHNIELLSPQNVVITDWPAKFQKLGLASLASRFKIVRVRFDIEPRFTGEVSLDDHTRLDDSSGNVMEGTVREFAEAMGPVVIEGAQKYIRKNFLSIYKTLADLKKTAIIDFPVSVRSLSLWREDLCYRVEKVYFRIVAHHEYSISPVDHQLLGNDALLSSGQAGALNLVVAQVANAPQGRVFLQPTTTQRPRKHQAK